MGRARKGLLGIMGLAVALIAVLLGYGLLISPSRDSAKQPGLDDGSILSASPDLYPAFAWNRRDYVVRCSETDDPVAQVALPPGWQARPTDARFASESFAVPLDSDHFTETDISLRRPAGRTGSFHIRCLPDDFPEFEFERYAPGGPRLVFAQVASDYAAFFDRNGTPVWWMKNNLPPLNPQVLGDDTLAWLVKQPGLEHLPPREAHGRYAYGIRDLDGKIVRYVKAADGALTDAHELLLLPNGNYLIGTFDRNSDLDVSAFGGSPRARGLGARVEELTPGGKLVWKWNSDEHIKLAETKRWWEMVTGRPQPYDYIHFNSADPDGSSMVLSFRHLDAVYGINRATGKILWKLGGTKTPESLKVLNDPYGSWPFGGQHDARIDHGVLSVFDNQTNLDRPPRVVRYRIDRQKHTATLISSFTDPEIPESSCCGSARQLPDGQWLVAWGGLGNIRDADIYNVVGAYGPKGRPIFRLRTFGKHMYRAQPVTGPFPSLSQLRGAMDEIESRTDDAG
ncbi:MAG: aryl-sulfate sulfotransferase [Solirubrobacterales bacterium]|nr:aryl-sulfate sulfotransferase [Solirubrobacterales bacterium]